MFKGMQITCWFTWIWKPLNYFGDEYRPDLLVSTSDKHLYVLELTIDFESNLTNNVKRKKAKYKNLIRELDQNFTSVNKSFCQFARGVWQRMPFIR
jgi:hypothetical protein